MVQLLSSPLQFCVCEVFVCFFSSCFSSDVYILSHLDRPYCSILYVGCVDRFSSDDVCNLMHFFSSTHSILDTCITEIKENKAMISIKKNLLRIPQ